MLKLTMWMRSVQIQRTTVVEAGRLVVGNHPLFLLTDFSPIDPHSVHYHPRSDNKTYNSKKYQSSKQPWANPVNFTAKLPTLLELHLAPRCIVGRSDNKEHSLVECQILWSSGGCPNLVISHLGRDPRSTNISTCTYARRTKLWTGSGETVSIWQPSLVGPECSSATTFPRSSVRLKFLGDDRTMKTGVLEGL